jgi:hypothetical protein
MASFDSLPTLRIAWIPLGPLRVAYLPAPSVLLLPSEGPLGEALLLGLAHHVLGHRAFPLYGWSAAGPAFDAPLEAEEARRFVAALLTPP